MSFNRIKSWQDHTIETSKREGLISKSKESENSKTNNKDKDKNKKTDDSEETEDAMMNKMEKDMKTQGQKLTEEFIKQIEENKSKPVIDKNPTLDDVAKKAVTEKLSDMVTKAKAYGLMIDLGPDGNDFRYVARIAAEDDSYPFLLDYTDSGTSQTEKLDISAYITQRQIGPILNSLTERGIPMASEVRYAKVTSKGNDADENDDSQRKMGSVAVVYIYPTEALTLKQMDDVIHVMNASGISNDGFKSDSVIRMSPLEKDLANNLNKMTEEEALTSIIGVSEGKVKLPNLLEDSKDDFSDEKMKDIMEYANKGYRVNIVGTTLQFVDTTGNIVKTMKFDSEEELRMVKIHLLKGKRDAKNTGGLQKGEIREEEKVESKQMEGKDEKKKKMSTEEEEILKDDDKTKDTETSKTASKIVVKKKKSKGKKAKGKVKNKSKNMSNQDKE